eukprot:jgi/Mesvir1/29674/Mv21512-RA.3
MRGLMTGLWCTRVVPLWRNHLSLVRRLLDIGADPNQKDAESGWTAVHRACYLGRFRAISLLLSAGGSLSTEDHLGRTPCDLVSSHLHRHRMLVSHASSTRRGGTNASISTAPPLGWPGYGTHPASWHEGGSLPHPLFASSNPPFGTRNVVGISSAGPDPLGDVALAGRPLCGGEDTDVFSWGSGTNYALGTGVVAVQCMPGRVDALHGWRVVAVSCAKFHSAAITSGGQLFTWGFGRGGRLGHPEFDIHSGQHAVIAPRPVAGAWGGRRVVSVAAAKHHTLAATDDGAVYSWGSNRDGRLGYTQVDTQPTPRRVAMLRVEAVSVAAANKHSAALSWCGDLYTWGCNSAGQLGYGTSNGCSSTVPRLVDALKGRRLTMVAASKSHNVVLSEEGEVFQWGFKSITPARVPVLRELARATGGGGWSGGGASSGGSSAAGAASSIKFHRSLKPVVVAVAAGAYHSTALTNEGSAVVWRSADASMACELVVELSVRGHLCTAVSAGKYRTTVVTAAGDLWAWEVAPAVAASGVLSSGRATDRTAGKAGTLGGTPATKGAAKKLSPSLALFRVAGIKGTVLVSVGERHSLAITQTYRPPLPVPVRTLVVPVEARAGPRYISGRPMPTPMVAGGAADEETGPAGQGEGGVGDMVLLLRGDATRTDEGRKPAAGCSHGGSGVIADASDSGSAVQTVGRGGDGDGVIRGGRSRAGGPATSHPRRSDDDDHALIFGDMDGDDQGGGVHGDGDGGRNGTSRNRSLGADVDGDDNGEGGEDDQEEEEEEEEEDEDDVSGASPPHFYTGSFGSLSSLSTDVDLDSFALRRTGSSRSLTGRRNSSNNAGTTNNNNSDLTRAVVGSVPRAVPTSQSRQRLQRSGAGSAATGASPASVPRSLNSSLSSSSVGGSMGGSVPRGSLPWAGAGMVSLASTSGAGAGASRAGTAGAGKGVGSHAQWTRPPAKRGVPSLTALCELALAKEVVEPKNVLPLLELTETLGTLPQLRAFGLALALLNLDQMLATMAPALAALRPALLHEMEELYDGRRAMDGGGGGGARGGTSFNRGVSGGGGSTYSDAPVYGHGGRFFYGSGGGGRQVTSATDLSAIHHDQGSAAAAMGGNAASLARRDAGAGMGEDASSPMLVPPPLIVEDIAPPLADDIERRLLPSASQPPVYRLATGIHLATGPPPRLLCAPREGAMMGDDRPTYAASMPSSTSSSSRFADASGGHGARELNASQLSSHRGGLSSSRSLFQGRDAAARELHLAKQLRAVRKKIQQVAVLREMQRAGTPMDAQQLAKLASLPTLQATLKELEAGVPTAATGSSSSRGNCGGLSQGQADGSRPSGGVARVDEKRKGLAVEGGDSEEEGEGEGASTVAGSHGKGPAGKGKGQHCDGEEEDGSGSAPDGSGGGMPGASALSPSPAGERRRGGDGEAVEEAARRERMEREEQMLADAMLAAALQEEEWAEAEVDGATTGAPAGASGQAKKKKKNKKKKDMGEGSTEGKPGQGAAGSAGSHAQAVAAAVVPASDRARWADMDGNEDDEGEDGSGADVSKSYAMVPAVTGKGKGVAVDSRTGVPGSVAAGQAAAATMSGAAGMPPQGAGATSHGGGHVGGQAATTPHHKQKSAKKGSLSSFLAGTLGEALPHVPQAAIATKAQEPAAPAWRVVPPAALATPSPSPATMVVEAVAGPSTMAAPPLGKGLDGRPGASGAVLASGVAVVLPAAAVEAGVSSAPCKCSGASGSVAPPRAASARPAAPRVPLLAPPPPPPSAGPAATSAADTAHPAGRMPTMTVLRFRTPADGAASIPAPPSTTQGPAGEAEEEDFWFFGEGLFGSAAVASTTASASSRIPIRAPGGRGIARSSARGTPSLAPLLDATAGPGMGASSSSPSSRAIVLPMAELLARRSGAQEGYVGRSTAAAAGASASPASAAPAPKPRAWSVAAPPPPPVGALASSGADAGAAGGDQGNGGMEMMGGAKRASFRDIQADQERKSRRWTPPAVAPSGNLALALRGTSAHAGPGTSPVPGASSIKPTSTQSPSPSPSLGSKSPGGPATALLGFQPSRSPGLSAFVLPESRPVNNRWYRGVDEDMSVMSLRHIFEEEAREAAETAARAAAEEEAARVAAAEAEEGARRRAYERAAEAERRRAAGLGGGKGKYGGKKDRREAGKGKDKRGGEGNRVKVDGGAPGQEARGVMDCGSRHDGAAAAAPHRLGAGADASATAAAGPDRGDGTRGEGQRNSAGRHRVGTGGNADDRHGPGQAGRMDDGASRGPGEAGSTSTSRDGGRGRGLGPGGWPAHAGDRPGRDSREGEEGRTKQHAVHGSSGRQRGTGRERADQVPAGIGITFQAVDVSPTSGMQVQTIRHPAGS